MKDPNVVSLRDVVDFVKRSRVPVVAIVLATIAAFVTSSFFLPKKFKSTGLVSIQSDYFTYPLIEEFIPAPTDPADIAARRDSLVRAAFSSEFLNSVGEKYGLLSSVRNTAERAQEVEEFLNRFEFYSLSPSTVQISAFANKAAVSESLANEAIQQVMETFASERRKKIVRARDNIRARIEGMALVQDPTSAVMANQRPELLKAELKRLESEIVTLTQQFSKMHPSVQKLEKRAISIRNFLNASASHSTEKTDSNISRPLVGGEPEKATSEVYESLVKKLNYLNIALDMEADAKASHLMVIDNPVLPRSSMWPNRPLFAVWGLLAGILIASVLIVFQGLLAGAPSKGRKLARDLETVFLGELPEVPDQEMVGPLSASKETTSDVDPRAH